MDVQVTLESKVAFLRQPSSFPKPAYRVLAIETHMSWVFLCGAFAYKLKKPVCTEFLDFRTLEARRYYCEEEVRLNRRLAPAVYLGVVALGLDDAGHLQLGGAGHPVDWLVRMHRLPLGHMLDYALQHGSWNAADMARVARRLAEFYRACAPVPTDPAEYRARLLRNIEHSAQELALPGYQQGTDYIGSIRAVLCAAQHTLADELDARVRAGRIVEGHGDLRPEHICLQAPLAVIDCLEFSRALRLADPADEIAFLALECERLGAPAAGAVLLAEYRAASADNPSAAAIHFYQGYRALLRAVIAARHLNEEKFRYSPHWLHRAGEYLALALAHAHGCA